MFGFDLPLWLIGLGSGLKTAAGALLRFFTTKPGCYIGGALVLVGAFWWQGHHGYAAGLAQGRSEERDHIQATELAAWKGGMLQQQDLDKGLVQAADHAGFLRGKAQERTVYLTKEVPRYVTVKIDNEYPLPCGLIRLHDAAADGITPESLGSDFCGPDDAAAPVKASDLAHIAIANYGLYHDASAKVIGLQDAVRALAKALGASLEITQFPANEGSLDMEGAHFGGTARNLVGEAAQPEKVENSFHPITNAQPSNLVSPGGSNAIQ